MMRRVDTEVRVLRNGAYLTTLQYAPDSTPTIRCDGSAAIKTSLTGTFRWNREVDWLNDELQPVLILNGVEHPIGLFRVASAEETRDTTGRSVSIEAFDRCWLVQTCRAAIYYTIPATDTSDTYLYEIKRLLTYARIALVQAPADSSPAFAEPRVYELGMDYLSIANGLLREIDYDDLFFGPDGVAVLRPYREPTADALDHVLDASNIRSLVLPSLNVSSDIYKTPNVFIVSCSNPDRGEMLRAVAENNNPQSPFSIPRRGRRIAEHIRLDYIADQQALQKYANRVCSKSMLRSETAKVETALLPGYTYHDIVGLRYGEISGLFVEAGWSMDFRPGGTMTHNLERVVTNLG